MLAAQPTAAGWILRMGSTAGIVGALLGLVGNLLHPATHTGEPEGVAHAIADRQLWVPDHLAIVLGLILVLGGAVAIARSIQGGSQGPWPGWARSPPWPASPWGPQPGHLDGLAAKQLAEAWATASPQEQAAALRLVLAEETINVALAPWSTSCCGVTFILYGLAVAWSQLYPRWLGWVVVRAGSAW
jgi:hypothetical protein